MLRSRFSNMKRRLWRRKSTNLPESYSGRIGVPPKFHIVITGWNCEDFAAHCLDSVSEAISLLAETPSITVVNDGSDDGTGEVIKNHPLRRSLEVLTNYRNMGAAYSRHAAILREADSRKVIVCIDLDDWVLPGSFRNIQDVYWQNPTVWATFGNWIDQVGRRNPQGFYTPIEIDRNQHRVLRPFNGTHIRSFRRFLYNAVRDQDLQDSEGKWLQVCTDAALVMPLLDQCEGRNVQWVEEPIYVYRRHSPSGTLARFGGAFKNDVLADIAGRPVKPRYSESAGNV